MADDECDKVLKEELSSVDQKLDSLRAQINVLLEQQSELVERKKLLENRLRSNIDGKQRARDWGADGFAWSQRLNEVLRDVFRLGKFRQLQKESINASMSGLDCLLVMPTGGGKSLCYQLPGVSSFVPGVTVVVSPLLSLMEDQVMALKKLGVAAEMLSASCSKATTNSVLSALVTPASPLRLLYVTPEKMAQSKRFLFKLEKCYEQKRLIRVAIDEVHCCSQWGHDFRPDYKFLGIIKRQFPGVPIIGLTATATTAVLDDVKNILSIPHAITFRAPYNRPNLFYEVRNKPASHDECIAEISELIHKNFKNMSGIIYCLSKKDAETVAADLSKFSIRATHYHADASPEYRSQVHSLWLQNSVQVIVATIAFGMGIDKPDVRFVIHHSLSKSMENYYQESGRAGRDDKEANCVLYYRFGDLFRQSCMVFTERTGLEKLYGMVGYCINMKAQCRRKIIAGQFSEVWKSEQCKSMCDCCRNPTAIVPRDLSRFCDDIFRLLDSAAAKEQRLTALKLTDLWLSSVKSKKSKRRRPASTSVPPHDCAEQALQSDWPSSRQDCETALAQLLLLGHLKEDFHFTPYSTISYLVRGTLSAPLARPHSSVVGRAKVATKVNSSKDLDGSSQSATRGKRPAGGGRKQAAQPAPKAQATDVVDILSDSSGEDDVYIEPKKHCANAHL